jgi:glycosyltransferase involved in cell wall biosynthesis
MTDALTVVNVAYPFAEVGPDAVGGAEQVVSMIDEALVDAGHRSLVVARRGSSCAGELITPPTRSDVSDATRRNAARAAVARTVERVIREQRPHLVHMHGVDFHAYLPQPGIPVLATLHLPLSLYPHHALLPARGRTWLHGVSASQMRAAPDGMPGLPVVTNGVRLDRLAPTGRPRRRYAIAMGRICPEKAFHLAIEAAESASVALLIAGRVFPYPNHVAYFRSEIAPRLRGRCRYVGPVGFRRKRVLLASARCLVVSSLIAETSSLVAMEALACGTPVVALRGGALEEVVEHGVTGFVVDSVEAMSDAIRRVDGIDPRACRAAAEARFDGRRTARAYLETYRKLAQVARAGEPCPT